jgi:hypothetical protein
MEFGFGILLFGCSCCVGTTTIMLALLTVMEFVFSCLYLFFFFEIPLALQGKNVEKSCRVFNFHLDINSIK